MQDLVLWFTAACDRATVTKDCQKALRLCSRVVCCRLDRSLERGGHCVGNCFATGFAYTQIRNRFCLYTSSCTNGNLCVWRTTYMANYLYGEANSSTQPCRAGKLLLLINFTDTNGVGLIVGKSVFPFSAFRRIGTSSDPQTGFDWMFFYFSFFLNQQSSIACSILL